MEISENLTKQNPLEEYGLREFMAEEHMEEWQKKALGIMQKKVIKVEVINGYLRRKNLK